MTSTSGCPLFTSQYVHVKFLSIRLIILVRNKLEINGFSKELFEEAKIISPMSDKGIVKLEKNFWENTYFYIYYYLLKILKVFFVLLNIILLITKINFSFGKIKLSKIN